MVPDTRFTGVLLSLVLVTAAAAAPLTGSVRRISDGDSFTLVSQRGEVRIQLCGISSPERKQKGWAIASIELGKLTQGKQVVCVPVGEGTVCDGRSGATIGTRTVAQCSAMGKDLAEAMVRGGFACDQPKFSGGHYKALVGAAACTK